MTHFTVLIRTELESGDLSDMEGRIAEMLDPFDENKEVEPRKQRISKKDAEEALKYYKLPNTTTSTMTSEQIKEYFGGSGGGKDGRGYYYLTTYNPKSKWDWYEVGGRWQGMLLLKPSALGIYHKKPNIGKENLDLRERFKKEIGQAGTRVDIAFLKDVDLDEMERSELEGVTETYYKVVEMVAEHLEKGGKYDDMVTQLYFEYGIEDESLEERLARVGKFSTHAVVDKNGWHEWSKMGWWGVHSKEKETEQTWNANFRRRWLSNPTDKTAIAVVDVHI